ncbi:MAG: 30S ribosomal protein S6 [Clostridia bacterium]|nr:30S ribosomal protein S6 [Clostridia bacterium]
MEEKLCSYETLFVVDPRLSEEDTKAVIEKFTAIIAADGTVEAVKEWGKRRLAYPINDLTEGYYVLVNFNAKASLPLELERVFGITDSILRSIVVRAEAKKTAPAVDTVVDADAE